MKRMVAILVMCGAGVAAPAAPHVAPAELEISNGGFPRVVAFRGESKLRSDRFPGNTNYLATLDGIIMKALSEELPSDFGGDRAAFIRGFEDVYTNKLSLNHFNHYGWLPELATEVFEFPGHFMYTASTVPTADVGPSGTVIHVADMSPLDWTTSNTNQVPYGMLIRTDALGNRLWDEAEYFEILDINAGAKTLTIARNAFGLAASPLAFPADGRTAVVRHAPSAALFFTFNYSRDCPLDGEGRTARDVMVDYLYEQFTSPSGTLYRAHGLAFDVPWEVPLRTDTTQLYRQDLNNNGTDAEEIADHYRSYTLGLYDFLKQLRERMGPDFIMTADGNDREQRAVHIMNGMEAEGFPLHHDPYLTMWSDRFNQFPYWQRARKQQYDFNYAAMKDASGEFELVAGYPDRPKNLVRLTLGGMVSLGLISTAGLLPESDTTNFPTNLWDEGTRGVEMEYNWLGFPRGPLIRTALDAADLLNGDGTGLPAGFVGSWTSADATIIASNGCLVISHNGTWQDDNELDLSLSLDPSYFAGATNGDLFVRMELEADPRPGFEEFGDVPRNVFVGVANTTINTITNASNLSRYEDTTAEELHCYAGALPFQEAAFYWRDAFPLKNTGNPLVLNFRFGYLGDVRIRNITVRNAPDLLIREFENGVVLCNPSLAEQRFNITKKLPGRKYYRLTGLFDPVANDGTIVHPLNYVYVPARDARFFKKTKDFSLDDLDGDNLPDAWELRYVATTNDLHLLTGDGVADFDNDGASDLREYHWLTHPMDGDDVPVLELELENGQGAVTWPAATGKFCRVLVSADYGQSWQPVGSYYEGFGELQTAWLPESLFIGNSSLWIKVGIVQVPY